MVGEHDFDREEGTEIRLTVAEIRVHPWYDSATFNNDIGTVRQGCQWLRSGFIPGTTVQHSTMI
jgi:hypothetical protein